jgi:cell division protein ZapA (FtsZ GTPase activity inhibitor)
MSGPTTSTTVRIDGVEHRIRGDGDPGYIARLAEYVDAKVREIKQHQRDLTTDKIAILASLTIADELLHERTNKEAVLEKVGEETERLAEEIRKSLEPS